MNWPPRVSLPNAKTRSCSVRPVPVRAISLRPWAAPRSSGAIVSSTAKRAPYLAALTRVPLLIIDDLRMRKLPYTAAEDLLELTMRRTRVVRIFPNSASCLRLIRALCAETHEAWLEDHCYLNLLVQRRVDVGRLRPVQTSASLPGGNGRRGCTVEMIAQVAPLCITMSSSNPWRCSSSRGLRPASRVDSLMSSG